MCSVFEFDRRFKHYEQVPVGKLAIFYAIYVVLVGAIVQSD
jgi:hypothetical protein